MERIRRGTRGWARCMVAVVIATGIAGLDLDVSHARDLAQMGNLLGGNQEFRSECPGGSYLVGLTGRAGEWIDKLIPICAPLKSDMSLGPTFAIAPLGTSDGGNEQPQSNRNTCWVPAIMKGLLLVMTEDSKYVRFLNGMCFQANGTQKPVAAFGNGPKGGGNTFDQGCPDKEYATGLRGRGGLFIASLGLICGPLVPQKLGTGTADQGRTSTSAFPTAPTVLSPTPNGMIIRGKDVFKIVPSKYLNGTKALYQLRWINAPAAQKGKGDFYTQEIDLSLLMNGLPAPQTLLAQGTWEFRAMIAAPKSGDWSPWVRFTYFLQNPILTTPQGTGATRPSSTAIPPGTMSQTSAAPCLSGFVWREARQTDLVCAPPTARDRVKQENVLAASRRSPTGGPSGPNTCLSGFVWREAYDQDVVCVLPESRRMAKEENALSASRTASSGGSSASGAVGVFRRGIDAGGKSDTGALPEETSPRDTQP